VQRRWGVCSFNPCQSAEAAPFRERRSSTSVVSSHAPLVQLMRKLKASAQMLPRCAARVTRAYSRGGSADKVTVQLVK